jgi:hypothetical protein
VCEPCEGNTGSRDPHGPARADPREHRSQPAAGCAIPSSPPSTTSSLTATPLSMKGWDLYTWRDEGQWNFALLPGTNRLKFAAEVRAARTTEWNKLEKALLTLPKGSEIGWNQQSVDGLRLEQPEIKNKTTKQITSLTRKRGLTLRGLPTR